MPEPLFYARHHRFLAAALSAPRPPEGPTNEECASVRSVWNRVVETLADKLAEDNPRFDRDRFFIAAGYCHDS